MYCKNCNFYNDDNSRFCSNCGAELLKDDGRQSRPFDERPEESGAYDRRTEQNGYGGNRRYDQPFNQYNPQYGQPQFPLAKYTNTLPIISIIASLLVFNVLGLLFAILSLIQFNKYQSAFYAGVPDAESFGKRSKTFGVVSLVFAALHVVLIPLIMIAVFLVCSGGSAPMFYHGFDLDVMGAIISNALAAVQTIF